ncbi:MAG: hypothetical protein JSV85_04200 [Candidatus Bathyarchaeota archaeon]|nr:MAG: hypothetical protein JSV85_04200 [Candidatus Bathyarchaeota archaeon]
MPISGSFYLWGEKARNVSAEAAVYELCDENYQPIFVGDSSNLKETFTEYLKTHFSSEPCKAGTKYYKREFTPSPKERKKEILEAYVNKYGKVPKCNITLGEHSMVKEKEVGVENGFFFYEDLDKPLHQVAVSVKDFLKKIRDVPVTSLEFHQNRGDFAKWIRNVFGAVSLADTIEPVKETGEALRERIIEIVSQPKAAVLATCPRCETRTRPTKIWNMTGRPSKMGESLKLTLGYYRCSECDKSFRKVIAKEKVRS